MRHIPPRAVTTIEDGTNFVQWYTDGSIIHGKSPILARSGWAAFVAQDDQHNVSRMLHGQSQSTYRAELRAVLHVVRYTDIHVIIRSDCKSVVTTANAIVQGDGKTLDDIASGNISEADLWQQLVFEITQSTHRQVKCRWMPAHFDDQEPQGEEGKVKQASPEAELKRQAQVAKMHKYIEEGVVTKQDIINNKEVDRSAKLPPIITSPRSR